MNLKRLLITGCVFSAAAASAAGAPRRVVSLAPSVTESVFLLGAQDSLVGVTSYCIYPKEAARKEKIGTILDPNLERIVMLKPDLVLGDSINDSRTADKLKASGLTVYVFPLEKNFTDICRNFLELGKLLGKQDRAREVVKKAIERIGIIKAKTADAGKPKVFIVVGTDPLITAGKGSFPDEIITLAGGVNIAHDIPQPYARYSREKVVEQDPAIILLSTEDRRAAAAQIKEWRAYAGLSAVKGRRIFVIDPHLVSAPVPSTFIQGALEAARLIHPEAFKK